MMRICSFVEQLALARPVVFCAIEANSGKTTEKMQCEIMPNHKGQL